MWLCSNAKGKRTSIKCLVRGLSPGKCNSSHHRHCAVRHNAELRWMISNYVVTAVRGHRERVTAISIANGRLYSGEHSPGGCCAPTMHQCCCCDRCYAATLTV